MVGGALPIEGHAPLGAGVTDWMREKIGKFEIQSLIGQGAMGEVFLGRDPLLDRTVAVKTIRLTSAFGEEAKARFEREGRAAGAMNHPNIVTVYEFGEDEGLLYMAMECVAGDDLHGLIQKGSLPQGELLELLAQACDGLAYAHDHQVIHRDIKPANILVDRSGKRPMAKLVDFGVALVGQSDLTQKGEWMGTVNYMAPEYLDTGVAVPASDLFAMGVILYEILTGGRRPFQGETATTVLHAILCQAPGAFTAEEQASLNPALLEVVNKALAKLPQDRYPNAERLAAAIREAHAGTLVSDAVEFPVPESVPVPGSRVLVVGKGGKGQCMSLRVALRQASAGMEIRVMPGVYKESLVVDKAVTFTGQGEPGDVVIESVKGPGLTLDVAGIRLENLTLRGLPGQPALLLAKGQAEVEGCALESQDGPAVAVLGPGEPVFRDCTFRGEGAVGFRAGAHSAARLESCLLEGAFRRGLEVETGARLQLVGCRILNPLGVGVHLAPGSQASLEACQLSGQEAGGVEVEAEARAELRNCRILDGGSVGVLALERGTVVLEACELFGHACAGVHAVDGAVVQLRNCRVRGNLGAGVAVLGQGLLTLDLCEVSENGEPAVLMQRGATVQMKGCKLFDGHSFGVVCGAGARGVLEGCEIYGNAQTGAKVEPGGSLLLVRCDLRDGRDTGILLFENAEVTLEECVVHRNARGGILLAKDASDPILRGANKIQDQLLRASAQGGVVKVAPVK